MLATAGQPPVGDWVVEPKFDGARCAARIGGGQVELFSRQANNLSTYFPDVVAGCAVLAHRDVILDGEIIVLDERTRPNFGLLQRRLHTPRPATALRNRHPARFVAFDVLHLDGRDLTALPYRDRRGILESLAVGGATPELATSPAWVEVDGREILEVMAEAGMEGVVCKAPGSSYRAGQRSRQWIKTPYRRSARVAIGGYFASGSMSVGALLVGGYDCEGDFIYCGTISVGFTARARRDLRARLAPLRQNTSPFRSAEPVVDDVQRVCWVRPHVVGRVEYREFAGRLRHAAWKGVVDADAGDVGVPERL